MSTSETRARSFSGKWVKYFTTANVLISLISGAMKKSPTCIFKARAMSVNFFMLILLTSPRSIREIRLIETPDRSANFSIVKFKLRRYALTLDETPGYQKIL